MSEWLKEHASKACERETVPRVRIPLSPPFRGGKIKRKNAEHFAPKRGSKGGLSGRPAMLGSEGAQAVGFCEAKDRRPHPSLSVINSRTYHLKTFLPFGSTHLMGSPADNKTSLFQRKIIVVERRKLCLNKEASLKRQ